MYMYVLKIRIICHLTPLMSYHSKKMSKRVVYIYFLNSGFYIEKGIYSYLYVFTSENDNQERLRWGAGGAATPSALIYKEQEGQELPFTLNSFHLSYILKWHFPAL